MQRVDVWSPEKGGWTKRVKRHAKDHAECVRRFRERKRKGICLARIELWPEQIEALIDFGYLTPEEAKDPKSVAEALDCYARVNLRKPT